MQYSNEQFLYMDFLFEFCFIDKYVWTLAKIFEMFTDKNVLDKSYKLVKHFPDLLLWEYRIV